jgi:hypothetical protein
MEELQQDPRISRPMGAQPAAAGQHPSDHARGHADLDRLAVGQIQLDPARCAILVLSTTLALAAVCWSFPDTHSHDHDGSLQLLREALCATTADLPSLERALMERAALVAVASLARGQLCVRCCTCPSDSGWMPTLLYRRA